MNYIYVLLDPRHDSFNPKWMRYVGRANNPEMRLNNHIRESEDHVDSNPYKCNWIRTLLKEGLKPILKVIQKVPDDYEETWQEAEKRWIKSFREMGYKLTNLTDGGDGIDGYKWTIEQRLVLSKVRKGNQNSKGVKPTEEARANMREGQRRAIERDPGLIKWRGECSSRGGKLLGNNNGRGNKGKKHTSKQNQEAGERERLRQANGGVNGMQGKKHSEKSKRLMKERRKLWYRIDKMFFTPVWVGIH